MNSLSIRPDRSDPGEALPVFPSEKSFETIIRSEYTDPSFNVSALTLIMKISQQYLYELTADKYRVSVQKMIEGFRVSKSVRLISEGESDMRDVAQGAGYADYQTFRKAFKRRTGICPSEFKEGLAKVESISIYMACIFEKIGLTDIIRPFDL